MPIKKETNSQMRKHHTFKYHSKFPWECVEAEDHDEVRYVEVQDSDGRCVISQCVYPTTQELSNYRLIADAPTRIIELARMVIDESEAFGFDGINVNCVAMAEQILEEYERK